MIPVIKIEASLHWYICICMRAMQRTENRELDQTITQAKLPPSAGPTKTGHKTSNCPNYRRPPLLDLNVVLIFITGLRQDI